MVVVLPAPFAPRKPKSAPSDLHGEVRDGLELTKRFADLFDYQSHSVHSFFMKPCFRFGE